MVDYRNILRLQSQGHSQREIERELYCSRHTISEVVIRAKAAGICVYIIARFQIVANRFARARTKVARDRT